MIPQTQIPKPPSRERLELMLANGPEMVDVVKDYIDKYKLPFVIEISDGIVDPAKPIGYGILRDTLSPGELHLQAFITVETSMLEMKNDARKMAKTEHEVLITGATGTGKEIIAKSMIADRKGQIMAVNCAGFQETLIESELFGHVKGSFTGAEKDKAGLMSAAKDGVMFLDEIGELPLQVQAKLLRALQEKRIRRVGALQSEEINCKFVCATHRNLKKMVEEGKFREDLYARISTLRLNIKSLMPDRKCDIIPITEALKGGKEFLKKYGQELQEGIFDLSLNVRSLQQLVIQYSVLGKVDRGE